jgi:ABC-type sugar transport system ATPase subunit
VRDAEAAGVVLVPQELHVAANLSIAENMFMGILPGAGPWVDERRLHDMAAERLRFFHINASPDALMGTLTPSEQRLVTIAAALSKSARLIILDEPTAALTEDEAGACTGRQLPVHFAPAGRDRADRRSRRGHAQRRRGGIHGQRAGAA